MRRPLLLLLAPCALGLLLRVWLRAPEYPLVIGVLSARHHRPLRDAIRATWALSPRRPLLRFIIGSRACDLPPADREDPYSCRPLNLTRPDLHREIEAFTGPHHPAGSAHRRVSVTFRVLHPIIVTRLGAWCPGLSRNLSVQLFQAEHEEPLCGARLTPLSPGTPLTPGGALCYEPVERFILPEGFHGTVRWDSQDAEPLPAWPAHAVTLNSGGGVLRLVTAGAGLLPHDFSQGPEGVAGGFTYTVHDGEALLRRLETRPRRLAEHRAALEEEEAGLREESHAHGDMAFVEVVDTYRSVARKLLLFCSWLADAAQFRFLLKTDDDCFLDLEGVYRALEEAEPRGPDAWWGNFRLNWAVERTGKWQELDYPSPAYPAFACGSGYVLSQDAVRWLARNAARLKDYQGEDVSVGIWMSAIGPRRYQDERWLCHKDCAPGMLSSPQHSPQELTQLWRRKERCGDPCACPDT